MARTLPRYSHLSCKANLSLDIRSVASFKRDADIRNTASCNAYPLVYRTSLTHSLPLPPSLSRPLPLFLYLQGAFATSTTFVRITFHISVLCLRTPVIQGQRWAGLKSDISCIRPNSTIWTCHSGFTFSHLTLQRCWSGCRPAWPHVRSVRGKESLSTKGGVMLFSWLTRRIEFVHPPWACVGLVDNRQCYGWHTITYLNVILLLHHHALHLPTRQRLQRKCHLKICYTRHISPCIVQPVSEKIN
ncbi:hypothetical protein V8C43DRAFT_133849 [Trichoderma afarasin]